MKRLRTYQKPSMRVINLPHNLQLLAGSDLASIRVARSDYGENVVLEDWE